MASQQGSPRSSQHPPSVPMVTINPPAPTAQPSTPLRQPRSMEMTNAQGSPPSAQASPRNSRRVRATSIRLKRQPSATQLNYHYNVAPGGAGPSTGSAAGGLMPPMPAEAPDSTRSSRNLDNIDETEGRKRSFSEPQRPPWLTSTPSDTTIPKRSSMATMGGLQNITEGQQAHHRDEDQDSRRLSIPESDPIKPATRTGRLRAATSASVRGMNRLSSFRKSTASQETMPNQANEYESEIVDLLDVVDPEVSTLSTLTNVQNSLFIPNLGQFINRRPTYELSPRFGQTPTDSVTDVEKVGMPTQPAEPQPPVPPKLPTDPTEPAPALIEPQSPVDAATRRSRGLSIGSTLSDGRYAVLPHGVQLIGWSEEDKEMLNDHVRHMLHSRRSAFKRSMKGFFKYIKRPLGFFVFLYATLITLFGLAWVLFLIGWINVGGRQSYLINVIDNVLVALFAVMGDGLIPFRIVDTYHMIFIAHYHYLSWQLRKEKHLPKLKNHNDLPSEIPTNADLETGMVEKQELSVLTIKQQEKLEHHAHKYSTSHTFYRPHETETHYAFPVKLLITVTVLLDFHSIFQVALGSCTWAISYHVRPQALTATILCCSISCNIAAGICIAVGDRMTRKKEIIELQFRQALTRTAIKKVQKHKRREIEAGAMIRVPETEAVVAEDDNYHYLDDDNNHITRLSREDARLKTHSHDHYHTPPMSPVQSKAEPYPGT